MRTIPQFFETSVEKYPNNPYMWEKKADTFEPATYSEQRKQVHLFAAGLIKMGIKKGDRIALLSEGRNDWLVSELGILYAGAVNVPLSTLLSPAEIEFRISHSGAKMIIVSKAQAPKIEHISCPSLESIILLDPKDQVLENELLFSDLKESGAGYLAEHSETFEKTWKSIQENDYANISYTSGTTAEPKGIILSHLNYYANVNQAYTLIHIPESWILFLFLPWDHAFAHTCGLYAIVGMGASLAALQIGKTPMESLKNIPINIKEIKPQLMFSVPAFAKNLRKNIESGIRQKGNLIEKLFKHALKLAYSYNNDGFRKGGGLQFLKLPLIKLYDTILFKKIREQLGGKMEYFFGGGALLDIELQRFFYAIGVPIYQGYGLSEASPIISINTQEKHKLGSSGMPVKNMELKICDENGKEVPIGEKGEIVVKGENVMLGYFKNDEATKEALKEGWLHTGDMGYIDKDGFLYVLGRFKSLLIADDGEKYSPEGIEEAMTDQSEYILQCMLYNNQDPYTCILLVPDTEALSRFLKLKKLTAESDDGKKAILKLLQSEVYQYRTGGVYQDQFPQRWMPSTIAILDQGFTQENLLLNSMRKMVRGKIIDHYQETIQFLYTPEARDINNSRNFEALEKLDLP